MNHRLPSRKATIVVLVTLLLLVIGVMWSTRGTRPDGPWAELTVTDIQVTDDNGITLCVSSEMPMSNYVSLTCPYPTIAASEPTYKNGNTIEHRDYYYIGSLEGRAQQLNNAALSSGFTVNVGDKILLTQDDPKVVVYDGAVGGEPYQMMLSLTDRPT